MRDTSAARAGLARLRAWTSPLSLLVGLAATGPCSAAESSEFVDSAAHVLAVVIIIMVPIGGIVLFWLVHILPERFAEKRHHPQLAAIKTLCLLSLVFGGLLWPLAWLWAFTKPVMHQLAYGRDKHDDYYEKHGLPMPAGDEAQALRAELGRVRQEIAELEKRGDLPTALQALRERLAELEGATAQQSIIGAG
jgi:CBS domain containing-hemolysin-like protein